MSAPDPKTLTVAGLRLEKGRPGFESAWTFGGPEGLWIIVIKDIHGEFKGYADCGRGRLATTKRHRNARGCAASLTKQLRAVHAALNLALGASEAP